MSLYFDFLPIEVLALCIPEDGLYDFFKMPFLYKNFKGYKLLDKFLLQKHPYYFKIMNREMKELSHKEILKKLLWFIVNYIVHKMNYIHKDYYNSLFFDDDAIDKMGNDPLFKILYPFILRS